MKLMYHLKNFLYNFFDYILALAIFAGVIAISLISYNNLLIQGTNTHIVDTWEETQTASTPEDLVVHVNIPSGVTVEQLAKLLKEYTVITDDTGFVSYFNEHGDLEKLKTGKVPLKTNMEFQTVLEQILKP